MPLSLPPCIPWGRREEEDKWFFDFAHLLNIGRNTSLSFNFKTKEFYFITRNAGGDCKALGVELEKLAKPRVAQIIDGAKIIQDKFAEMQRAAYDVLSSEFRKRVELLNAKERAK